MKTHCRNGHAYTPENTGYHKAPGNKRHRACRTCNRRNVARHREMKEWEK